MKSFVSVAGTKQEVKRTVAKNKPDVEMWTSTYISQTLHIPIMGEYWKVVTFTFLSITYDF